MTTITKLHLTEVPAQYQKEEGCVAFQKIQIEYSFYGCKRSEIFDTKILSDGSQYIIDGSGFFKDGYKIN